MTDTAREPEVTILPSKIIPDRPEPKMENVLSGKIQQIRDSLEIDLNNPPDQETLKRENDEAAEQLATIRRELRRTGRSNEVGNTALTQEQPKIELPLQKPAPLKPTASLRQKLIENPFIRSFDPDLLPTKVATVIGSLGSSALTVMTIGSFINGGLAEALPLLPNTLIGVGITAGFLIMQRVARNLKNQRIRQSANKGLDESNQTSPIPAK